MPRPQNSYKPQPKDMYWFAHGGIEPPANQCHQGRSSTPGPGDTEDDSSESSSLTWKSNQDRKTPPEEPLSTKQKISDQQDGIQSAGLARVNSAEKRLAVEERRRQILEAEQEKNDAILKKHAEREAALEARRNAHRSNISFAFGKAVQPNAEVDISPVQVSTSQHALPPKHEECLGKDGFVNGLQPPLVYEVKSIFPASWLVGSNTLIANNLMTQSMTASVSTARGRRKNDLTPTVPYDRLAPPRPSAPVRKRSVSMSRLDILAQPRRPYVEAQKANSTMSSSSGSTHKDARQSPNRPLSAASEKASGSNRLATTVVHRRPQTTVRKSRPVSIAGSIPDQKKPPLRTSTPLRGFSTQNKPLDIPNCSVIAPNMRTARAKSVGSTDRSQKAPAEKPSKQPSKAATSKTASKAPSTKPLTASKPAAAPPKQSTPTKQATPKTSPARKLLTNKKQATMLVATAAENEENTGEMSKRSVSPERSVTPDDDSQSADEKSSSKRIISEEEARAALAEKRRLAREQAEREAELERQRQEELRLEEEERLRKEEEEQRRMEEEQLKLLDEHRKCEEEKLKRAIEEQERREEEEKTKREEEARIKAEQEKKAKEEAEKQRIELEEKLRKEEEERAERKKRLEKIMSRTRGKSGTASPSGSASGSDQPDSVECQNDGLSSEMSSLESNVAGDPYPPDIASANHGIEQSSPSESLDVNQTLYLASQSLSSNDLMLPSSSNTSLDGSLQVIPSEQASLDSNMATYSAEEKTLVENIMVDGSTFPCTSDEGETVQAEEELLYTSQAPEILMKMEPETTEGNADEVKDLSSDDVLKTAVGSFAIEDEHEVDQTSLLHAGLPPAEIVLHDDDCSVGSTDAALENLSEASEQLSVLEKEVHELTAVLPEQMDAVLLSNDKVGPRSVFTENEIADDNTVSVKEAVDTKVVNDSSCPSPDGSHVAEIPAFNEVEFSSGDQLCDPESVVSVPEDCVSEVILTSDIESATSAFEANFTAPGEEFTKRNECDLHTVPNDTNIPPPVFENTALLSTETDLENNLELESHKGMADLSSTPGSENLEVMNQDSDLTIDSLKESSDISDNKVSENAEIQVAEPSNPFASDSQFDAAVVENTNISADNFIIPPCKETFIGGTVFLPSCERTENDISVLGHSNMFFSESPIPVTAYTSSEIPLDFDHNLITDVYSSHVQNASEIAAAEQSHSPEQSIEALSHVSTPSSPHRVEEVSEECEVIHGAFDTNRDSAVLISEADLGVPQNINLSVVAAALDGVSDDFNFQSAQSQNPFHRINDALIAINEQPLENETNVEQELLLSALNYGDDSEGSSLDSNLSQILNVHSDNLTNFQESHNLLVQEALGNGGLPTNSVTDKFDQQANLHNNHSLYDGESISKSNGFSISIDNTRLYDDRFESVVNKTDTTSASSNDFHFQQVPEKTVSSTNSSVDNVDSVNSNKVASNPFLGASDSNPFSANPFQVQEEKTVIT